MFYILFYTLFNIHILALSMSGTHPSVSRGTHSLASSLCVFWLCCSVYRLPKREVVKGNATDLGSELTLAVWPQVSHAASLSLCRGRRAALPLWACECIWGTWPLGLEAPSTRAPPAQESQSQSPEDRMGTFSLLGCSLGAKGREAQGVVGIWRAKAAGTTVWEVGGVMVWAGLPAWGGSQHSPLPQACLPHAESRIDSSIWKSTAPVKQWQLLPQGPGEKEAVPGARPLQTRRVPRSPWAGSRTVRTPQAQQRKIYMETYSRPHISL